MNSQKGQAGTINTDIPNGYIMQVHENGKISYKIKEKDKWLDFDLVKSRVILPANPKKCYE